MSEKLVLKIDGMTCGHCAASVTKALKQVAGVSDVAVNLGEKQAVVTHAGADVETLKVAVEDAGYDFIGVA